MFKLFSLVSVLVYLISYVNSEDAWQGKWFPYGPNEVDPNSVVQMPNSNLYDEKHQVKMGVEDPHCDDAKSHLEQDWDFSPVNYTCFDSTQKYRSRSDIPARYSVDFIPAEYNAIHKCMDTKIEYAETIPTFGTHRPLWAKYGEYTFLPRQRWLHNLEHGAIVMLYHPCADKNEVNLLRKIVNKCLYRYVITPYNLLSEEYPLALVAWGHRLEMSKVHFGTVLDFIESRALHGPEQTARDGQYSLLLEEHAQVVSDVADSAICQYFKFLKD